MTNVVVVADIFSQRASSAFGTGSVAMPWGAAGTARFFPSLTWQSRPQVESLVSSFPAEAIVMDLGAGGRRVAPHVVTVDLVKLPDTDIVANVTETPFGDGSVDLVIATGLLEHVEDEDALIREVRRILKDGGTAHVELPFLQQYHEDPIDYRRFTLPGLESFLVRYDFRVLNSGTHIGPSVSAITILAHYLAMWFEGESFLSKIASNGVFMLASILLYPLKFADGILVKKRNAHRLAFGVFCTVEKLSPAQQSVVPSNGSTGKHNPRDAA